MSTENEAIPANDQGEEGEEFGVELNEEDLLGTKQNLFSLLPKGVVMYVVEEQLYEMYYLNGSQIYREPFVVIKFGKEHVDTAKGGLNAALGTIGTALAETVIGPAIIAVAGFAANMWVDSNCNEDGSADIYLAKHYAGTRQTGIDVTAFPLPGVPTMLWDSAIEALIQGVTEMTPLGLQFGSSSLNLSSESHSGMSVEVPPIPEAEENEELTTAGIEAVGDGGVKSINRAYAFIRWSGAPLPAVGHGGHVGWGFIGRNTEGRILYLGGATEGLPEGSPAINKLYVPPGEDAFTWNRAFESEQKLLKFMKQVHKYDAYKVIPVKAARWQYAYNTGKQLEQMGYTGVTNNCLDHAHAVIKAYGATELPDPFRHPLPKDWYNLLPGPSINL